MMAVSRPQLRDEDVVVAGAREGLAGELERAREASGDEHRVVRGEGDRLGDLCGRGVAEGCYDRALGVEERRAVIDYLRSRYAIG
jgi:hypothetical protein